MSQPTTGDLALGVFWIGVIVTYSARGIRWLLRKKPSHELRAIDQRRYGGAAYACSIAESSGHLLPAPSERPETISGLPN